MHDLHNFLLIFNMTLERFLQMTSYSCSSEIPPSQIMTKLCCILTFFYIYPVKKSWINSTNSIRMCAVNKIQLPFGEMA